MRISSTWRSLTAVALATLLSYAHTSAADLSQAVVRQKVNVVTLAPSITAAPKPAAQGSVVRNENVVRTGTESRAELEFSDQTLARMGSNSIFSFDAQARALNFTQGALLFSKPASSGRVEVRAGAITAAITGSTGFISNMPGAGVKKKRVGPTTEEGTTMLGMLEGKLKGNAAWRDGNGKEQTTRFSLGAGEMLVAQPGQRPVVVQFDLPRFLRTSPLITKFSHPLLNAAELNRAVAAYESDLRHGFIDPSNVMVTTQPQQVAWVGYNSPNRNSFDVSVHELGAPSESGGGDFVPVGGTGIIRGQLVWTSTADLDLHLILPSGEEVYYANPTVIFNTGRATAMLDHDNLGHTIDLQPNIRVENIHITGLPSSGIYSFFAHSFFTPNGTDTFTLRVLGGGRTQVITGSLSNGQNSGMVTVNFIPPGH